MSKPLQTGDLVWYNVGGRGYETVGLVIEAADLYRDDTSAWGRSMPTKYANCVRIKWMRVGALKPRPVHLPLYRTMRRYHFHDMSSEIDGMRGWEKDSVMPALGEIETGEWYEGRFFKNIAKQSHRQDK